jgi:hypothetical protein
VAAKRFNVPGLMRAVNEYRTQAACCVYCIDNLDTWLIWIDCTCKLSNGYIHPLSRGVVMGQAAVAFAACTMPEDHAKVVKREALDTITAAHAEKLPAFSSENPDET